MTVLRPVIQRLPISATVLEDTSLPLSGTITPYGDRKEIKVHPPPRRRHRNHAGAPEPPGARPAGGDGDGTTPPSSRKNGERGSSDSKEAPDVVIPAALAAKCTSCGAPLNPCDPRVSSGGLYLCGLCGTVFSADVDDQIDARSQGGDWAEDSEGWAGSTEFTADLKCIRRVVWVVRGEKCGLVKG